MKDDFKEENQSDKNNVDNPRITTNVVAKNVIWKFAERFLAQGISFIVSLVLARLLTPDDYGYVAIIMIFISIADVILSSGFVMAYIRKKEVDELDLSSIFYANLTISLLLYVILFFTAPLISRAYELENLTWLLRIIALKLPVSSFNTIQSAIVSRNMKFKKFFFATLTGTIVSAIVGILMAYRGYGAWALIAQHLTNLVIDTIILSIFVRWVPKFKFSWKRIKILLPFSSRNMTADVTGTVFNQLNAFVVGIKYTTADLAYYTKGQQLPNIVNSTITSSLTSVMYPAISKVADDVKKVKKAHKKSISLLAFILFPIMLGLAAISKEFVLVFYTDKWIDMVFFMEIMCIDATLGIIGTLDILTLKAIGKANVVLILEFIKKPVFLGLIILSMFYGVRAIAWCQILISMIALIVNSIALQKYTGYSIFEKIKDCLFPIITSIIMFFLVYYMSYLPLNYYLILVFKILTGILIYFIGCLITKNKYLSLGKDFVKEKMNKKVENRSCDTE